MFRKALDKILGLWPITFCDEPKIKTWDWMDAYSYPFYYRRQF